MGVVGFRAKTSLTSSRAPVVASAQTSSNIMWTITVLLLSSLALLSDIKKGVNLFGILAQPKCRNREAWKCSLVEPGGSSLRFVELNL